MENAEQEINTSGSRAPSAKVSGSHMPLLRGEGTSHWSPSSFERVTNDTDFQHFQVRSGELDMLGWIHHSLAGWPWADYTTPTSWLWLYFRITQNTSNHIHGQVLSLKTLIQVVWGGGWGVGSTVFLTCSTSVPPWDRNQSLVTYHMDMMRLKQGNPCNVLSTE